ncbi:MAG: wax ester/triacylglycerol synthase family O-acyltransferase [Halioglobus sp.]|nr:wax ester/triacylglycerol synthase family O-acyltransferase [Halioglobus sp.]
MSTTPIPALDLMFYLTETPQSPKHVGAVQVFQLPPDAPDDYLRQLVAAFKAAPVVAPFNRRPHFPRLGRPEWHTDPDLELDYHVRHLALPRPGDDRQLMDMVQRLHAPLLDRQRPGWICHVIEGLRDNRFAVYTKIHHAYIDGMSGVKRMYGSLSPSPRTKKIVPTWSYQPGTDSAQRPQHSRPEPARHLAAQVRGAAQASGILGRTALQLLNLRDSQGQVPFCAARTRMNRTIERETRTIAACTLPLDEVRAVARRQGCTVNEVVLAVIGAALQDYLEKLGEPPQESLVALCPMSIRAPGDDTASTQVSAIHVQLGAPQADIGERLQHVMASSRAAKDEVRDLSAQAMVDYGVVIFGLWEVLARTRLDQVIRPSCNVLVSNVPGPGDEGLYLCGSRLRASYPISTLLPGVNLNATLLSHGNSLDFGLLGDGHALPELDFVVERMAHHFAALQRQVLGGSAKKKTARKARRKTGAAPRKNPTARRTRPRAATSRGG